MPVCEWRVELGAAARIKWGETSAKREREKEREWSSTEPSVCVRVCIVICA